MDGDTVGENRKTKEQIKIKYNEDDILEILTEYIARLHGYDDFNSKSIVLGTPGVDLRAVAVVSSSIDESIDEMDMVNLDKEIEYSGVHSKARYIDPSRFADMKIEDC